jgi:ADP-L-glycero-D-manno-heptose 6-epimerase
MIIVTGADGFIGKNLVNILKGESILRIDRHNSYAYLNQNPSNITHVYHLGAISSTTETDFEELYKHNICYSIDLFEWCIKHQIPISYASSAATKGNGQGPINLYGASKLMVDIWVKNNIERFKSVYGYRFFNVYGQGEDHKIGQASPISTFIKQAKETGQIKLFQTHNGCRDFIWVGVVCRIMLEESRPSGIYDCGTSNPQYFSSIANLVAKKYGVGIIRIPTPDHIKKTYQERTCAQHTDDKCISVEDYLSSID